MDAGGYALTVMVGRGARGAARECSRRPSRSWPRRPCGPSSRYRFCTNLALRGRRAGRVDRAARELGDSVMIVGDGDATVRVHVHTDDPDAVIALFAEVIDSRPERHGAADVRLRARAPASSRCSPRSACAAMSELARRSTSAAWSSSPRRRPRSSRRRVRRRSVRRRRTPPPAAGDRPRAHGLRARRWRAAPRDRPLVADGAELLTVAHGRRRAAGRGGDPRARPAGRRARGDAGRTATMVVAHRRRVDADHFAQPRPLDDIAVRRRTPNGSGSRSRSPAGRRPPMRRIALGLHTVGDLLFHLPRDTGEARTVATLAEDETATVLVEVRSIRSRPVRKRGMKPLVVATVADATGVMEATFFNQPWLERHYRPGTRLMLTGKYQSRGRFRVNHHAPTEAVTAIGETTATYPGDEGHHVHADPRAGPRAPRRGARRRRSCCPPRLRRQERLPGVADARRRRARRRPRGRSPQAGLRRAAARPDRPAAAARRAPLDHARRAARRPADAEPRVAAPSGCRSSRRTTSSPRSRRSTPTSRSTARCSAC